MRLTVIGLVLLGAAAVEAGCGNPFCVMCYGLRARTYSQPSQWQPVVASKVTPVIESTPQIVVDAMLARAALTPEDRLYDLGCGDGRVLKTAAKRWGTPSLGIEIDKRAADLAKRNCKGLPVRVLHGDARKYVLSNATVVFMYLDKELMVELVPKCTGARLILSYSHQIPGLRNRCYWVENKYPFYVASPAQPARAPTVERPLMWAGAWKEFRRTK